MFLSRYPAEAANSQVLVEYLALLGVVKNRAYIG